MKTTDEREMQNTTKEKQAKAERSKENRSYSEKVRAKSFCWTFKLGFLQLICKAFLILILYFICKIILNELKTSLKLKFSLQSCLQSFESLFLIWCERLPINSNLK